MTDDYAPFPEAELLLLAEHNEINANYWARSGRAGDRMRDRCIADANVCRNAVAAHVALRERMLIAEMDNRQAKAS